MPHDLSNLIGEFDIKIIIGYGSAITGIKKGIFQKHDIDIILVSDVFCSMSNSRRREIIREKLGEEFDVIPLTNKEYENLRKKKESVVNIALNKGRVLPHVIQRRVERTKQKT